MTKLEVLELLRELIQSSPYTMSDEDDWSGLNTTYLVDHEALLKTIESKIREEE